jgi:hypothetical protein
MLAMHSAISLFCRCRHLNNDFSFFVNNSAFLSVQFPALNPTVINHHPSNIYKTFSADRPTATIDSNMGSKKYQAQRRILCKRRKQAKRAADLAAQVVQAGQSSTEPKDASAKAVPHKSAAVTAQQPLPSQQVRQVQHRVTKSPTQPEITVRLDSVTDKSQPKQRKTASEEPRRKIKTIDLRKRMRILEKTVVWMADGMAREEKQYRKRIEKLELENVLLQADIAALKRGWWGWPRVVV